MAREARSWPSSSSPPATAASSPCSTARTSCWRWSGAVEIANFPEASRAVVKGPYDLSLVEGSITTPHDAERIQQVRSSRASWSRSAPAPPPAASRRCATSRTCASSPRAVYATPEYISTLGDLDADRRARAGRLRAARLPDQQGPAPRGARRLPARPQARHPDLQRLRRVQAAGHRLRDGGARHALPRAGHPGRLRRALPGLRPRLLRLLRPGGDAEHRGARPTGGRSSSASTRPDLVRAFRTFNAWAAPFRDGERRP